MAGIKGRSGRKPPAEPWVAFQVRLPASKAAALRARVEAEDEEARTRGHSASVGGVLARVVLAWLAAAAPPEDPPR